MKIDRHDAFRQTPALGAVLDTMMRLQESDRPIIVGPWLTEIGFEVLYWIPFLRWALKTAKIDPARPIVVSRGGCGDWYAGLASQYVDIFDLMTVEQFFKANQARVREQNKSSNRKVQKQFIVSTFDDRIVAQVRDRLGLTDKPQVLHPSLMNQLFTLSWRYHAPLIVDLHTIHRPFPKPPKHGLDLPERYVAVKFYNSKCFSGASRAFIADTIRTLTETSDVVLLETGLPIDDHSDVSYDGQRVHRLEMPAAKNLEIQTRVIAGAASLVSTYGGFSYLGPMLNVPTTAYVADPKGYRADHLTLAQGVFEKRGYGAFTVSPAKSRIAA